MLQHNSYFDGQVQSVAFERQGRKQSIGVIEPGTHEFGTAAAERMTVVSGEMLVQKKGEKEAFLYPAGTYFEVEGDSSFTATAKAPVAYLCEYF